MSSRFGRKAERGKGLEKNWGDPAVGDHPAAYGPSRRTDPGVDLLASRPLGPTLPEGVPDLGVTLGRHLLPDTLDKRPGTAGKTPPTVSRGDLS